MEHETCWLTEIKHNVQSLLGLGEVNSWTWRIMLGLDGLDSDRPEHSTTPTPPTYLFLWGMGNEDIFFEVRRR